MKKYAKLLCVALLSISLSFSEENVYSFLWRV